MDGAILWAAVGTGFTFLMTSLGSAMVFFFKSRMNPKVQRIMLGFAAGVMIAAAVWSLLVPAIEEASANGQVGWVPAAGGMALGVAFLMLMDSLLPHLHVDALQSEGLPASFRRTTLLVLAVTLHNIPEGMAVGLSFARAAQHTDGVFNAAALALALGIRGRGHLSTPASGGLFLVSVVCVRKPFRHCGAHIWNPGGADRG